MGTDSEYYKLSSISKSIIQNNSTCCAGDGEPYHCPNPNLVALDLLHMLHTLQYYTPLLSSDMLSKKIQQICNFILFSFLWVAQLITCGLEFHVIMTPVTISTTYGGLTVFRKVCAIFF